MHSTVPTSNYCKPDYQNGTLELFIKGASSGLHTQIDVGNLNLDVTANIYNMIITGTLVTNGPTSGTPELRLQAQNMSTNLGNTFTFSVLNKEAGDAFTIGGDIPNATTTSMRLTGSSAITDAPEGITLCITNIVIEYKGPRE
jgi:hypothetical protein